MRELSRAPLPPLVDRAEEAARIAEALDAAERGRGQLLLIRGEAGCGKTRLAQEAVMEADRRGFAVGSGTSLADSVVSYHPWIEALRGLGMGQVLEERPPPKLLGLYITTARGSLIARAVRTTDRPSSTTVAAVLALARGIASPDGEPSKEGPLSILALDEGVAVVLSAEGLCLGAVLEGHEDEAFLADLRELLRELEPTVKTVSHGGGRKGARASIVAALRRLLDEGKYEGVDYALNDPKLRQTRLFEQVTLGLVRRTQIRPQLVVIDDLQWADPSSLALLQHAARNLRNQRATLIGTYRMEEAAVRPHLRDALRSMELEGLPAGILVSGLPRAEMRRLVEVFLGPHALPADFLNRLWEETQGYPLFVREVLRGLEDEGAIQLRGTTKRLDRLTDELALPRRVREAIRLRLEKLPKHERRLLDAAAACGLRFSTALLAKVAGEDPSTVLPGLDRLAHVHGLLRTVENGFAFDHPAVQEVAYQETSSDARRSYHLGAAEWLELVGGPAEDVAEHYYRAGDARAAPRLKDAARSAMARFANEEAARLLQESLELAPPNLRADLLEMRADTLEIMARYEEALQALRAAAASGMPSDRSFRKAAEILTKQGRFDEALTACQEGLAVAGEEERIRLRLQEAVVKEKRGELDGAAVRAQAVLDELGDQGPTRDHADALGILVTCHLARGRIDDAWGAANEILKLHESQDDRRGVAEALNRMASILERRGDLAGAIERCERSLAIREAIGDRAGVGRLLNSLGLYHYGLGEFATSLDCYRRSLAIAESIGARYDVGIVETNVGNLLNDQAEFDRALEAYGRALAISEALGDQEGLVLLPAAMGNVHMGQGSLDRAVGMFERSLALAEESGMLARACYALCGIGFSRLGQGELSLGLQAFERGLAWAEAAKHVVDIARVYTGIGWVRHAQGDAKGAEEALRKALDVWRTAGNRTELADSHSILAQTLLKVGRQEEARENADLALEIARRGGWPDAEARALLTQAMCLSAAGRMAKARRLFADAIARWEGIRADLAVAEAHLEWGRAEGAKGLKAAAREHLDAAEKLFAKLELRIRLGEVRRAREGLASPGPA